MEGDDGPQWPRKVAALVNGRIRGKEILLSLCRRAHRDKAQCLYSLPRTYIPPDPRPLRSSGRQKSRDLNLTFILLWFLPYDKDAIKLIISSSAPQANTFSFNERQGERVGGVVHLAKIKKIYISKSYQRDWFSETLHTFFPCVLLPLGERSSSRLWPIMRPSSFSAILAR